MQLVEKVPGKGEELKMFSPYGLGDGRFIIRTGPDDFETVTAAGERWFLDDWGNAYMRDVSGNLQPVEPPTMEEQINRALVEGQGAKAMALADFRDRPSAEERFRLAMEFARSPGDLMTISAILRGNWSHLTHHHRVRPSGSRNRRLGFWKPGTALIAHGAYLQTWHPLRRELRRALP